MRKSVLIISQPSILDRLELHGLVPHRMSDNSTAIVCDVPDHLPSALFVGIVHQWISSQNRDIPDSCYDVTRSDEPPDRVPANAVLFIDHELRTAAIGQKPLGLHAGHRADAYNE